MTGPSSTTTATRGELRVKGPGEREIDVCLASLLFHPAYAGPAVRFRRYAPGLAARGVRMRVFSSAFEESGFSPGALFPSDDVDGIEVQRVAVPTRGRDRTWLAYMRALTQYCRAPARRPDLVHLLGLWTWSPPWLLRLRAAGIPLVYTHTMMTGDAGPGRIKAAASLLPYRFVDRVVVSSSVMERELRESGVRAPIEVIGNGVDLRRFRPVESLQELQDLRIRLGLDPEAEIVVFIGGFLSERKGVDVLAEAWGEIARRPRAQLVLVGSHLDDMRPEGAQIAFLDRIQSLLDSSGARERLHITGPVDRVEDYIRAADLFVFPSRREGMPNVVLEAFACGIASILTPFEGLSEEFGRPGEHYLLSERTPQALANAVTKLLENPRRREQFATAGRRWAEAKLDVEFSLDRYTELYRTLSSRNRDPG